MRSDSQIEVPVQEGLKTLLRLQGRGNLPASWRDQFDECERMKTFKSGCDAVQVCGHPDMIGLYWLENERGEIRMLLNLERYRAQMFDSIFKLEEFCAEKLSVQPCEGVQVWALRELKEAAYDCDSGYKNLTIESVPVDLHSEQVEGLIVQYHEHGEEDSPGQTQDTLDLFVLLCDEVAQRVLAFDPRAKEVSGAPYCYPERFVFQEVLGARQYHRFPALEEEKTLGQRMRRSCNR